VERGAHIGLATDGDADRFGLVDAGGTFLEPNYFLGLLLSHLVRGRGWQGVWRGPSPPATWWTP